MWSIFHGWLRGVTTRSTGLASRLVALRSSRTLRGRRFAILAMCASAGVAALLILPGWLRALPYQGDSFGFDLNTTRISTYAMSLRGDHDTRSAQAAAQLDAALSGAQLVRGPLGLDAESNL